jgi:ABC-type multidrug transport system fused ATPase/permease subunit
MVQLAINNLMANRTVILIAHRLSTIKNADVIAVVAEGRVVEQGSHKELLSHKDGLYSKLVNRQLERVDMDPIFD